MYRYKYKYKYATPPLHLQTRQHKKEELPIVTVESSAGKCTGGYAECGDEYLDQKDRTSVDFDIDIRPRSPKGIQLRFTTNPKGVTFDIWKDIGEGKHRKVYTNIKDGVIKDYVGNDNDNRDLYIVNPRWERGVTPRDFEVNIYAEHRHEHPGRRVVH